jgi:hypothetical protein
MLMMRMEVVKVHLVFSNVWASIAFTGGFMIPGSFFSFQMLIFFAASLWFSFQFGQSPGFMLGVLGMV